jgi:MarR family 2-MHQ and catechol resistance regulon transcriptional repressor
MESPAADDEGGLPLALARRHLAEFPWADVAAIEATARVVDAEATLRSALARFIAASEAGLVPARFQVLRALYLAEGRRLSLGEIARAIRVTSTNVTSLIDGLERDGWVIRVANPFDRRVTYGQLTAQGEARCATLVPAVARAVGGLFSSFSESEKAELNRLLIKLRRAAESA